ncbi:hypothetical protein AC1031_005376, partial [Aphanomyces cochlioides]
MWAHLVLKNGELAPYDPSTREDAVKPQYVLRSEDAASSIANDDDLVESIMLAGTENRAILRLLVCIAASSGINVRDILLPLVHRQEQIEEVGPTEISPAETIFEREFNGVSSSTLPTNDDEEAKEEHDSSPPRPKKSRKSRRVAMR